MANHSFSSSLSSLTRLLSYANRKEKKFLSYRRRQQRKSFISFLLRFLRVNNKPFQSCSSCCQRQHLISKNWHVFCVTLTRMLLMRENSIPNFLSETTPTSRINHKNKHFPHMSHDSQVHQPFYEHVFILENFCVLSLSITHELGPIRIISSYFIFKSSIHSLFWMYNTVVWQTD